VRVFYLEYKQLNDGGLSVVCVCTIDD